MLEIRWHGRGGQGAKTAAQFLAEAQKLDLPVIGPIRGEEAAAIVKTIYAAPPALVARAREIVGR